MFPELSTHEFVWLLGLIAAIVLFLLPQDMSIKLFR